jgi:hypothetical protein
VTAWAALAGFVDEFLDALSFYRRRGHQAEVVTPSVGFADRFARAVTFSPMDPPDAYTESAAPPAPGPVEPPPGAPTVRPPRRYRENPPQSVGKEPLRGPSAVGGRLSHGEMTRVREAQVRLVGNDEPPGDAAATPAGDEDRPSDEDIAALAQHNQRQSARLQALEFETGRLRAENDRLSGQIVQRAIAMEQDARRRTEVLEAVRDALDELLPPRRERTPRGEQAPGSERAPPGASIPPAPTGAEERHLRS